MKKRMSRAYVMEHAGEIVLAHLEAKAAEGDAWAREELARLTGGVPSLCGLPFSGAPQVVTPPTDEAEQGVNLTP